MGNGLEEVGLAQTGVPVDEQRVVRPGGGLGHGHCGRVREAVGGANDEVFEGVPVVEHQVT